MRADAIFIAVEVDDTIAQDPAYAAKLTEVCTVDIFAQAGDGTLEIKDETHALRILPSQTERLEHAIDEYNERLAPLNSFVLPGGSAGAADLHVARTVTRRAERRAVTLKALEPGATGEEPIRYLNRLSDLLFVLARVMNDNGKKDVLWVPGKNRGG